MRQIWTWIISTVAAVMFLILPATAEEAVAVQLNGELLTFSDAAPQVRQERTFLPFRAVFEAMGAEVDYQGNVITAQRGEIGIQMTLGSKEVTVAEGGGVRLVTMDVAPYVDPETWRTYVPVRFAAETLGCAVGWDQEAYTAVILDPQVMLVQAKAGKSFTWMQAMERYMGQYDQGTWDLDYTLSGYVELPGALSSSLTGSGSATVSEGRKMESETKLDLTELLSLAAIMRGETLETTAAQENTILQLRGETDGTLYLNLSGPAAEEIGELSSDQWYAVDPKGLGTEEFEHMADIDSLLRSLLGSADVNSISAYQMVSRELDEAATALSDLGFTWDGPEGYAAFAYERGEASQREIGLYIRTSGSQVVGCYAESTSSTGGADAENSLAIRSSIWVEEDGSIGGEVACDATIMGAPVEVELTVEGRFTAGHREPETTPPAGAVISKESPEMGIFS